MVSVTVLSETTKFPLEVIGERCGICWNASINDSDKNIKRAKNCIISGHYRVLEFVNIELLIKGCSARVIREWYTHIGSLPTRLQESTRYVNCENFKFVIPTNVKNNPFLLKEYQSLMSNISNKYKLFIEKGIDKEDAALILPLGMETKIVDKRNLRNLIEMFHQRSCSRAYWEYRDIMKEIKSKLSEISDEWKWIADNYFIPKCEVAGYCTENKCCGRKPKKEDKL